MTDNIVVISTVRDCDDVYANALNINIIALRITVTEFEWRFENLLFSGYNLIYTKLSTNLVLHTNIN